jgi:broad specificity phosphatase PhoE
MVSRFKAWSIAIEATNMTWKAIAVFLAACTLALPARADEALWSLLKSGGQVVLMRHAVTTPGAGDPEGMVLNDCSTQRNLTDEGRAHAKRVGETVRARGIVVTQVLSSPWCRCLDTARLAFGANPEMSTALSNLFGQSDPKGQQIERLRELISRRPLSGNTVLVSHGSTIQAVTGVSPATGEMIVITPHGAGKFTVAGRLEVSAR